MRGHRGQLGDVSPCVRCYFTWQRLWLPCLDFPQVLSTADASASVAAQKVAPNQVSVLAPPQACLCSHHLHARPWAWIRTKRATANATANDSSRLSKWSLPDSIPCYHLSYQEVGHDPRWRGTWMCCPPLCVREVRVSVHTQPAMCHPLMCTRAGKAA